jgi:hypothetical protein
LIHMAGCERKHSKHENPPPFLPTNVSDHRGGTRKLSIPRAVQVRLWCIGLFVRLFSDQTRLSSNVSAAISFLAPS